MVVQYNYQQFLTYRPIQRYTFRDFLTGWTYIFFKFPLQQVLILHTLGLFKGSLTRDFHIQVFSLISGPLSTPLGQFLIFWKHITGVVVADVGINDTGDH
jgi:hypothetical protein